MAGRPATLPLMPVLSSLAQLIGQSAPKVETASNSTWMERAGTEYEVLAHVNQEIRRIDRILAAPS